MSHDWPWAPSHSDPAAASNGSQGLGRTTLRDRSDPYRTHDSERLRGLSMGNRRDDVVLTSKARIPVRDGPNESGASRQHVRRAVEHSLQRLRTEHLDLLYIHQWDGQTPIAE